MCSSKLNICPFCRKEISAKAAWCGGCGRDLLLKDQHSFEIPPKRELYEIVPEGEMFGIAIRGEIKIHGLEKESAQSILAALNCQPDLGKPDKSTGSKFRQDW
jgi:hypothetical protein